MDRDEIIGKLRAAEGTLKAQGVTHAALFGSKARDAGHRHSDIDIMIDLAPDPAMDVFLYAGIVGMIRDLFPGPVDVAYRGQLKPHVRPNAERDAIYAF